MAQITITLENIPLKILKSSGSFHQIHLCHQVQGQNFEYYNEIQDT